MESAYKLCGCVGIRSSCAINSIKENRGIRTHVNCERGHQTKEALIFKTPQKNSDFKGETHMDMGHTCVLAWYPNQRTAGSIAAVANRRREVERFRTTRRSTAGAARGGGTPCATSKAWWSAACWRRTFYCKEPHALVSQHAITTTHTILPTHIILYFAACAPLLRVDRAVCTCCMGKGCPRELALCSDPCGHGKCSHCCFSCDVWKCCRSASHRNRYLRRLAWQYTQAGGTTNTTVLLVGVS